MSQQALVEIEMPESLHQFKLPVALNERLQNLLDRQDRGETLIESERKEKQKGCGASFLAAATNAKSVVISQLSGNAVTSRGAIA